MKKNDNKKIFLLIFTFFTYHSAIAKSIPENIIGIGGDSCSSFVETYEAKQRINNGQENDVSKIVGIFGAYGDFTGTFGGFLAAYMMNNGDTKIPFKNDDHAMSLAYAVCKKNPNIRFIDAVWAMSESAFGKVIK